MTDDTARFPPGWLMKDCESAAKRVQQLEIERGLHAMSDTDCISALELQVAALRKALTDAKNNGLIYWEPNTTRGHVAKAEMLARIDAALSLTGKE